MENNTLQSMLRVKHGECNDEPVSSNDTQGSMVEKVQIQEEKVL